MTSPLASAQRLQSLSRRNDLDSNKLGQDLLQNRCVNPIVGCGLDYVVRDDVDVVVEIIKTNSGGQDHSRSSNAALRNDQRKTQRQHAIRTNRLATPWLRTNTTVSI